MNAKCQSCGMPLKGDPKLQGTNADGSKSDHYCHYCFQHGAFTRPDFTAKEMQTLCVGKMKELGFSKPLAWLFTRSIPKLKRWSENNAT